MLKVIKFVGTHNYHKMFLVRCDCGKEYVITEQNIKKTKMCRRCAMKTIATKHGIRYTKLYRVWLHIKERCYNKKSTGFYNYGGRGIKMCDMWKNNPKSFYDWAVKHGYKDKLTIERIDVNGDYCPENCRWATSKEQANNRRNNRFIAWNNENKTMKEWAEYFNINYNTFRSYIKIHGFSEEYFQKLESQK